MTASAKGLIEFIHESPSPHHCVAAAVRRLEGAGFRPYDLRAEPAPVSPGEGYYAIRGGSIIAWRAGTDAPAAAGFRLVVAHTDSPNLRLKPAAEFERGGFTQWGVETYGGVLWSTWLDRDLGISGVVTLRGEGGLRQSLLRVDRPIARIPNLAIHLNRSVNTEGLKLNPQQHLPPLFAQGPSEGPGHLKRLIAGEVGCDPADIMGWEIGLHDVVPPTLGGLNEEFIFAPRLDNQYSCYVALEALLATEGARPTTVIALFDHEEVGSRSSAGADSLWLRQVLYRLVEVHAEQVPGDLTRACANSYMISTDMTHGLHPNYIDRHDPEHKPLLNGGPSVKTNSSQRYATNAFSGALFRAACAELGVPVQEFVTRTDMPCGSTVGPICSSTLGIPTVDVGCPMLSMHSAREQAGAHDVAPMVQVVTHLLGR